MPVRSLRLPLNPWVKTALHHAHTSSVPSKRRSHLRPSRRPLNEQKQLFQHLFQRLFQRLFQNLLQHLRPPRCRHLCRHLQRLLRQWHQLRLQWPPAQTCLPWPATHCKSTIWNRWRKAPVWFG